MLITVSVRRFYAQTQNGFHVSQSAHIREPFKKWLKIVVSKMLTHKNVATTKIYADVVNQKNAILQTQSPPNKFWIIVNNLLIHLRNSDMCDKPSSNAVDDDIEVHDTLDNFEEIYCEELDSEEDFARNIVE